MKTPKQLLEECEDILGTFDPSKVTLDTHAFNVLGPAEGDDVDPDKVFVKQVFYGCLRYRKVLRIAVSSFYYNNSSKAARADYTKYTIFAYLAIFRLQEMGFPEFKNMVRSQPAGKMHVFLSYLFDESMLNSWMKDGWIKVLDISYVEGTMIAGLLKFSDQVAKFLINHRALRISRI